MYGMLTRQECRTGMRPLSLLNICSSAGTAISARCMTSGLPDWSARYATARWPGSDAQSNW